MKQTAIKQIIDFIEQQEYNFLNKEQLESCKKILYKAKELLETETINEKQQERSYSEEEVEFIGRLITFFWIEHNSEHPDNLTEFELSKSILKQFKKK